MINGGFQEFTLIDYPNKVSCIIFTQGCNFKCGWCHNPELVEFNQESRIKEEEIFSFLEKRKGKLDAVVITGGEPTLQQDLINFIKKIKSMNFLVKLDTNGSNPQTIKKLIDFKIIDYLAMDVKAPLEKYNEITNSHVDLEKIKETIKLITNSNLDYEFRTTVIRQLNKQDIIDIVKLIKGTRLYILQKFIPSKTLDPKFKQEKTYSNEQFLIFKKAAEDYVTKCIIR